MNPHPPTIGTLDFFEDIVAFLARLDVPYALIVGMPNTPATYGWTNVEEYGSEAIAEFRESFSDMMDESDKLLPPESPQ